MIMWNESAADNLRMVLNKLSNITYGVVVRGSTHFDFTDLVLYSPVLKFIKAFGSIDGDRMIEIVNRYAVAFFDECLQGEMSPLLDGPSPAFPEVTIEMRNPGDW
jgi:hypothetical protein